MVVERAIADFFTLLIGRLTKWNAPVQGGGDPVYLNAEQSAELAVAGIRMLSPLLPAEAAKKIEAAVEKYPRHHHAGVEEAMLSIGSLGGVIHHGTSGPPGCCVMINGRLVCTRLESASR
ncbi:MAG: hypothetical protein ABR971_15570 [Acidobacteriaceae bacterium]|jgi:hypothetical protein